jgi:DNA-binding protein H-NS
MKGKSSALAPFAKSITKARAEARRLPLADLEKLVASLTTTLASEKTKLEKKQSQERTAAIKKVNTLLAENGLQPSDLKRTSAKPKRKSKAKGEVKTAAKAKAKAKTTTSTKANSNAKSAGKPASKPKRAAAKKSSKHTPVPPRYRLEIDGKEYLWSGRGRAPKIFQAYFDAGNSRESCEITA